MSKLKYYIIAVRPKTLPASLSPVLVGIGATAYKGYSLNYKTATLAALGALFLQMSSNLVNDYFDFKKGVDHKRTLGPERVTQSNLLSAMEVKIFFITTFLLAFAVVTPLILQTGLPMMLLTLSCFLAAYLYTGGPLPLSYIALGELLAFLFFGPLAVWGIFLTQTQIVTLNSFGEMSLLGSATGLISAQIMSINNYRDRAEDSLTKKKTLAIFLGKGAKWLPLLLLILSILIPITLFSHTVAIYLLLLTPLPFIKRWLCLFTEEPSQKYNSALAATGQYMFVHAITFMIIMLSQ